MKKHCQEERVYKGLALRQRESSKEYDIFCFAAPAKDVRAWAGIRRTWEETRAAQRMLSGTHVRQIRNYLDSDFRNVIPTAVTIALEKDSYELTLTAEWADRISLAELAVRFPGESVDSEMTKPGKIIDGQHRLKALEEYKDSNIPILIAVLLGLEPLELALQFIVINNTAKKVPVDLVRSILTELKESEQDQFYERVQKIGLTLGKDSNALAILDTANYSPFRHLLDWDRNRAGERVIKPSALDAALRIVLADLEVPDGLQIDDAVQLLAAMWRGIREAWKSEVAWHDPSSKLLKKAGLVAATEFLVERLNLRAEEGFDLNDESEVSEEATRVFSGIPSRFWTAEWTEKSLDTSAGRNMINEAMAHVRRNVAKGDPPFKEVDLVEQKGYEGDFSIG